MTEPKRPLLSIRRKPKIYVNPKHAEKPAPPPKPLSREERIARNRAKKLRQGQEAIASLVAHWPQLFSLEQPKPLKTGIAADILDDIKARELDLTRAKASAALMFYTQTPVYQQAVHAGGSWFDLGGQPCGEVTEQQQAHALRQLGKWSTAPEDTASSP